MFTFQWVQQSIKNITEDSTNEKALYVTHEDICESFEGDTLLAIQAPNGSQLEVPIPEQSGLKKKYQIHLKSTEGQIYVLLVNKDPDSDHPGAYNYFVIFDPKVEVQNQFLKMTFS